MKRLLIGLLVLTSMLVVPAAVAEEDCEPVPPPEGAIELGTRQPNVTYTVTVEAGLAIATVGNDDCSVGRGSVIVDGVMIPAPTVAGGQTTAELGFLEAGTYTFDVTVKGRISVWLLIETVVVWEDELACSESTMTVGDGDVAPMATFVRGDDDGSEGKNPDPCSVDIGYNLDSETNGTAQSVTMEFETSEFPSWFGEFTWTPEPAVLPVPATELDLDGDGIVEGTLQWCSGFSGTDGSTGNPLPIMPAGESWCLVSQSSTLLTSGEMQITQTVYGLSDPDFIRPK